MIKKIFPIFLLFAFLILPLYFYSCCADEQCAEEDTYGKTVIRKTDTVFQKTTKIKRGPMSIQIAAFVNKINADAFARIAHDKLNMTVDIKMSVEGIYRVVIGEYNQIEDAREIMKKAKDAGYYDAFIRDEYGTIEK